MSMVLISLLGAEYDNRKLRTIIGSRAELGGLLYNPNPLAYFGITYISIAKRTGLLDAVAPVLGGERQL